MSTPSFVTRLRNNVGRTITFTSTEYGTRKVIVKEVKFSKNTGNYVLVGRDVTNIATKGAPYRSFITSEINRPVSYR